MLRNGPPSEGPLAQCPQSKDKRRLTTSSSGAGRRSRAFSRAESTVKRWEASRGLPVHRIPGGGGSSVYAYEFEMRNWLAGCAGDGDQPPLVAGQETITSGLPRQRWRSAAAALLVVLLFVGGAYFLAAGMKAAVQRTRRPIPRRRGSTNLPSSMATRTPAGLLHAIQDFEAAIARDHNFALAWVGLANSYNLVREFATMPAAIAYPRAKAAAERAIALDPSIAEAHAALAFDDFYWLRDRKSAEREFVIALTLDPRNVDAHHWYATFLEAVGRYDRAISEIERARNSILPPRPFSPMKV